MNENIYEKNETMKLIGNGVVFSADSEEGKQMNDVFDALNMPMTEQNYLLALSMFNVGLMYGKRQERNRRTKNNGK